MHSDVYLLKSIMVNLNKMNIDHFVIKKYSELMNNFKYKNGIEY